MARPNRITVKEWNLIKGALRRVFSRSDLRREVLKDSHIQHTDPWRPRVTKWSRCAVCDLPTPSYKAQVDHVAPIVPVEWSFEEMSLDDAVNRIWCVKNMLQVLCKPCHSIKTKQENAERRKYRKERKK